MRWPKNDSTVHRQGHHVGAVVEVAEHHAPLPSATTPGRGQGQHAPAVWPRRPQSDSPAREPVQDPMCGSNGANDPSRGDPGPILCCVRHQGPLGSAEEKLHTADGVGPGQVPVNAGSPQHMPSRLLEDPGVGGSDCIDQPFESGPFSHGLVDGARLDSHAQLISGVLTTLEAPRAGDVVSERRPRARNPESGMAIRDAEGVAEAGGCCPRPAPPRHRGCQDRSAS